MIKYFCDFCQKELPNHPRNTIQAFKPCINKQDFKYEICDECFYEIYQYVENKRIEKQKDITND